MTGSIQKHLWKIITGIACSVFLLINIIRLSNWEKHPSTTKVANAPAAVTELEEINLAEEYEKRGEFIPALEHYGAVLRRNPKLEDIWMRIGHMYELARQFKDAEKAYREAANIRPDRSDLWCKLGILLLYDERDVEALDAFQRALQVDPNCSLCYSGLGIITEHKGDLHSSVALYQMATVLNSSNGVAWIQLAGVEATMGQTNEAISTIREALGHMPGQPALLDALARLLAENPLTREEAERISRSAISAAPAVPALHETLGRVLSFGINKREEALLEYRSAWSLFLSSARSNEAAIVARRIRELEETTRD